VTTDVSVFTWLADTPTYHADQSSSAPGGDYTAPSVGTLLTVTAATAADLPTSITLANNIRAVHNLMLADGVAHVAVDTANVIATAVASDLATTEALLNALKAAYNLHRLQSGVHVNNDTVNSVATANATDLATSQTLANALKAAYNLHLASAPGGESIVLLPM